MTKNSPNNSSQVVIFDFDGTLANTFDLILKLFNEVASNYNLPVVKSSDKEKLRNFSARELISEYKISPWKLLQLTRDILPKVKQNAKDISLVEGMLEVVMELKKRGVTMGIVTSNSKENVELFLMNQNISQIDFIHSEKNLFGKGKVLRHVLQQQKFTADKVIYVGDEVRDIEAARAAGILALAVTWGFNSEERLQKAQPDYLVTQPEQIVTQLEALL